jgi:hypothetical protein
VPCQSAARTTMHELKPKQGWGILMRLSAVAWGITTRRGRAKETCGQTKISAKPRNPPMGVWRARCSNSLCRQGEKINEGQTKLKCTAHLGAMLSNAMGGVKTQQGLQQGVRWSTSLSLRPIVDKIAFVFFCPKNIVWLVRCALWLYSSCLL